MVIFTQFVAWLGAVSSFCFESPRVESQVHISPPVDFVARNLKTITEIYNLTVYPNNLPIIQKGGSAVPPGLFAPSASGRISPLGNFTGFEDSIEYFFGLAFTPQPPHFPVFASVSIEAFSSGCASVASSVAYLTVRKWAPGAADDGAFITRLKQVAFWRFDAAGAVLLYDAWIPNLHAFQSTWAQADFGNRFVQLAAIASLCPVIQDRCTGANRQYESTLACELSLAGKPFGSFDEVWGDNYVCRGVHTMLTAIRPDIHCSHVGPTGGMKCVDVPYNSYYFDDADLFAPYPAGEAFKCSDAGAGGGI